MGQQPLSGMPSLGTSRFTLSDAFDKAGWHTVSDSPTNGARPPGKYFFHYDQLLSRYNAGYHGPTFSYSPMPDQYTLSAFQRLELAPGHKPVMAEIDLTSSHWPWAPLPTMVPWNKVGDGSIFDPMPAKGASADHGRAQRQPRAPVLRHSRCSTRCRPSPHGSPSSTTQISCSSCSAMRSPTPPSAPPDDQSRGADLDHRPRPVCVPADCLLALAGRDAAQQLRSARANERLP